MTALLGPRDRDAAQVAVPNAITVVAHPELETHARDAGSGAVEGEKRVEARLANAICRELGCVPSAHDLFGLDLDVKTMVQNDFDDPVTGRKSIAALASVGNTGLTVLVATPETQVDALAQRMLRGLRAFVWLPLVLGLVILGALLGLPVLARAVRAASRARRRPS